MEKSGIRIGLDLGGTKIEAIALDASGKELLRERVPTPWSDYRKTIESIAGLVRSFESRLDAVASVGVGIPGCIAADTGVVKLANTLSINNHPLDKDLSAELSREVRVANDANCLAVSEATDGAAAGYRVVFAVILGTGCGGGVAVNAEVHNGPNAIAGEWGHNPLPWQHPNEYPGVPCYCGLNGCIEQWISGTGFSNDYNRATGLQLTGPEIAAAAENGEEAALAAFDRFEDRLARSLSTLINLLDPDCIVIGGGMSKNKRIYRALPKRISAYVMGNRCSTPILQAKYGDSSGVRGAAWLWPL